MASLSTDTHPRRHEGKYGVPPIKTLLESITPEVLVEFMHGTINDNYRSQSEPMKQMVKPTVATIEDFKRIAAQEQLNIDQPVSFICATISERKMLHPVLQRFCTEFDRYKSLVWSVNSKQGALMSRDPSQRPEYYRNFVRNVTLTGLRSPAWWSDHPSLVSMEPTMPLLFEMLTPTTASLLLTASMIRFSDAADDGSESDGLILVKRPLIRASASGDNDGDTVMNDSALSSSSKATKKRKREDDDDKESGQSSTSAEISREESYVLMNFVELQASQNKATTAAKAGLLNIDSLQTNAEWYIREINTAEASQAIRDIMQAWADGIWAPAVTEMLHDIEVIESRLPYYDEIADGKTTNESTAPPCPVFNQTDYAQRILDVIKKLSDDWKSKRIGEFKEGQITVGSIETLLETERTRVDDMLRGMNASVEAFQNKLQSVQADTLGSATVKGLMIRIMNKHLADLANFHDSCSKRFSDVIAKSPYIDTYIKLNMGVEPTPAQTIIDASNEFRRFYEKHLSSSVEMERQIDTNWRTTLRATALPLDVAQHRVAAIDKSLELLRAQLSSSSSSSDRKDTHVSRETFSAIADMYSRQKLSLTYDGMLIDKEREITRHIFRLVANEIQATRLLCRKHANVISKQAGEVMSDITTRIAAGVKGSFATIRQPGIWSIWTTSPTTRREFGDLLTRWLMNIRHVVRSYFRDVDRSMIATKFSKFETRLTVVIDSMSASSSSRPEKRSRSDNSADVSRGALFMSTQSTLGDLVQYFHELLYWSAVMHLVAEY